MIGIVIPVYNEGEVIEKTLDEVETKVEPEHEIYIVYDFAEDDTLPVVQRWADQHQCNIKMVQNYYGRGALNAIKTGFEAAETDAVLVVMADMSDDLSAVNKMCDLVTNGYDVVCGSRYCKGGKQLGGPLLKRTMSRLAGISLHYLTRIPTHDVTNSFKMYRKSLLNTIIIESTGGFELGMEVTVKAHVAGYRIGEVASIWYDRTAGESRFQLWAWLPSYLRWYFYAFKSRKERQ